MHDDHCDKDVCLREMVHQVLQQDQEASPEPRKEAAAVEVDEDKKAIAAQKKSAFRSSYEVMSASSSDRSYIRRIDSPRGSDERSNVIDSSDHIKLRGKVFEESDGFMER